MQCARLLAKTGVTKTEKTPDLTGSPSDNFLKFKISHLKSRIYTALGPGFFTLTFFTGDDVFHINQQTWFGHCKSEPHQL